MGFTVFEKILNGHLLSGKPVAGEKVRLRIDQTLTQDATGTMVYLELETTGISRVRTELSVSYVDHNMIQGDHKNPDDHRYLQDAAAKYGVVFSRPGNGICHQAHLERFARPGRSLLGSDSHTPTSGGMGMIAMGSGGLDVALAMAGEPFTITMPRIVRVYLTGKLPPFVSAKDLILEILRRISVKGGVGKVLEYDGPGVANLSIPERATVANMGAETGATTSIFPSDEITRAWLEAQGRKEEWIPLKADESAQWAETLNIDVSSIEPLVARPFQPDNVVPVQAVAGTPVDQVMFGSCTNSSLRDIQVIAHILSGRKIHPRVDVGISPGSRQVMVEALRCGALEKLIESGVRILESSCGACVGMGFAPPSDGVSLRTINRNFPGRCGHSSGKVFLVSPEVAAASALFGVISDPRELERAPFAFRQPDRFAIDDSMFLLPPEDGEGLSVRRGPNIVPLPDITAFEACVQGEVLLKMGDDITTDHIIPAGARILPLRSNIFEISKHTFEVVDDTFYVRAMEAGGGFLVGGENYGQGSSREHAALAPRFLGVQVVLVKSFARIHLANLVNFGILPLIFRNGEDYERISQGDRIVVKMADVTVEEVFEVRNETSDFAIPVICPLSAEELGIVKAGGRLNCISISR